MKRNSPVKRAATWRTSAAMWMLTLSALLLITGIAWLVLDTFYTFDGEFGPRHHPLQAWMLPAHGLFAMAMLIALGGMLPNHVRRFWQAHCNRGAGLALLALLLTLSFTGYLLYYLGDEYWRPTTATLHWIVGLLMVLALPLHMVLGRRATIRSSRARAHD